MESRQSNSENNTGNSEEGDEPPGILARISSYISAVLKDNNRVLIYALLLLALVAFVFTKALIVLVLGSISALMYAVIIKKEIPVDFSIKFFLTILISKYFGLGYGLTFLVVGDILPSVYLGYVSFMSPIMWISSAMMAAASVTISLPLVLIGVVLTLIHYVVKMIAGRVMGEETGKIVLINTCWMGINLVYFWRFGPLIAGFLHFAA